jgi:hypothetical protein
VKYLPKFFFLVHSNAIIEGGIDDTIECSCQNMASPNVIPTVRDNVERNIDQLTSFRREKVFIRGLYLMSPNQASSWISLIWNGPLQYKSLRWRFSKYLLTPYVCKVLYMSASANGVSDRIRNLYILILTADSVINSILLPYYPFLLLVFSKVFPEVFFKVFNSYLLHLYTQRS